MMIAYLKNLIVPILKSKYFLKYKYRMIQAKVVSIYPMMLILQETIITNICLKNKIILKILTIKELMMIKLNIRSRLESRRKKY